MQRAWAGRRGAAGGTCFSTLIGLPASLDCGARHAHALVSGGRCGGRHQAAGSKGDGVGDGDSGGRAACGATAGGARAAHIFVVLLL